MQIEQQLLTVLRALVREEVDHILSPRPKFYSTERRDLYPPGRYSDDAAKARRQARDRIKTHAAHERCGTGKSTEWRVNVDAYHAPRRVRIMALVPTPNSDEAIAQAAMAAAGLRRTRRSA